MSVQGKNGILDFGRSHSRLAGAIGSLVLLGSLLEIDFLHWIEAGLAALTPLTASCFLFVGVALMGFRLAGNSLNEGANPEIRAA
jgi:hypothetical protein